MMDHEWRPHWSDQWVPARIVRVIEPGGWIDRLFGGHSPVYVIDLGDGNTFATYARTIRRKDS